MLFVIDTNKESIAVQEARRLNIPVVAVVDSNSDPSGIKFPIPGNDDALRAIQTYCDLVSSAVLDGLQAEMTASGIDIGAQAEARPEAVPGEEGEAAATNGAAPAEAAEGDKAAKKPAAAKKTAKKKRDKVAAG
jgi:small subunit ribosomal protein S2